jgi:hypothetical protein
MLGDLAEETLRGTIRFMNQHHYQILLRRGMGLLTSIAQGHYRNADRQVTQIEALQALVKEKEEVITERNETIIHREDQINESDAIITQRDTIIKFLQEQVHDLILEVDDINELQQQPAPPTAPEAPQGEEEDPEEIEGLSDLDSEHGNPEPNPQPDHSSSGSQSSVGDFDNF